MFKKLLKFFTKKNNLVSIPDAKNSIDFVENEENRGKLANNTDNKTSKDKVNTYGIGIIKWYSSEKKYGFIDIEDGDIFFHKNAFLKNDFYHLNENELVVFIYGENNKGLVAKKIQFLKKDLHSFKTFDLFLKINSSFKMKNIHFNDFKESYILEKYKDLNLTLKEVFDYPHPIASYSPNQINKVIGKDDYDLSLLWVDKENKNYNFELAKMISARAAEIAVKEFYSELEFNVQDISIRQLQNNSCDWKYYDILLDDKICIDVKNTRGNLNSTLTYSEFIIPKFKKDRLSNDILIEGVLSPYLKLDLNKKLDVWYVVKPDIPSHNINILGNTTVSKIESLLKNFSSETLSLNLNSKILIPDWIFDYNLRFYSGLIENKKNFISKIKSINLPENKEYLPEGTASVFLSVGIDYPYVLTEYQEEFYNRLLPKCKKGISRPYLYLAVLKFSLEKLSIDRTTFSPSMLKEIIYYNSNKLYPLGLYDPTYTLYRLIDALEVLYKYNDIIETRHMEFFKYTEKGILSGKNTLDGKWYTLFAYCGGFIDGKGYCGYQPLIRGEHENCNYCGKLICPDCSYCSEKCKSKV